MAVQDNKEVVKKAYDAMSHIYRGDDEVPTRYIEWVDHFTSLVPIGSSVLDVGCGCGVPTSKFLSDRGYSVTGVDISQVQVDRAAQLVPQGTFLCADFASDTLPIELQGAYFQGIVAFYVIIHVPLDEQPRFIRRIHDLLEGGGYCMIVVGCEEWTGEVNGWRGSDPSVKMWWSQTHAEQYRQWVKEVGFVIERDYHIPDEDGDGHQMLVLRKPKVGLGE
jgi:2-polyprenyl-3-methyl-5-hydroxy-6-metoxy-1,4-benzoquinol methylase